MQGAWLPPAPSWARVRLATPGARVGVWWCDFARVARVMMYADVCIV